MADTRLILTDNAIKALPYAVAGQYFARDSELPGFAVFPDQAMTLAAIDRLVHYSTILEMNVESYRRRSALEQKRGRGKSPMHATVRETNAQTTD